MKMIIENEAVYLYNRNVVYSIQVVYKKIMTKKYRNIRLEVGSLAYEIAEEAIRNNKVVSKHFSECFTSISQKKNERLEFDFDIFLGSIESFYGKEKRDKIEHLWPLIIKKILNGKPLDEGYISELTELIEED